MPATPEYVAFNDESEPDLHATINAIDTPRPRITPVATRRTFPTTELSALAADLGLDPPTPGIHTAVRTATGRAEALRTSMLHAVPAASAPDAATTAAVAVPEPPAATTVDDVLANKHSDLLLWAAARAAVRLLLGEQQPPEAAIAAFILSARTDESSKLVLDQQRRAITAQAAASAAAASLIQPTATTVSLTAPAAPQLATPTAAASLSTAQAERVRDITMTTVRELQAAPITKPPKLSLSAVFRTDLENILSALSSVATNLIDDAVQSYIRDVARAAPYAALRLSDIARRYVHEILTPDGAPSPLTVSCLYLGDTFLPSAIRSATKTCIFNASQAAGPKRPPQDHDGHRQAARAAFTALAAGVRSAAKTAHTPQDDVDAIAKGARNDLSAQEIARIRERIDRDAHAIRFADDVITLPLSLLLSLFGIDFAIWAVETLEVDDLMTTAAAAFADLLKRSTSAQNGTLRFDYNDAASVEDLLQLVNTVLANQQYQARTANTVQATYQALALILGPDALPAILQELLTRGGSAEFHASLAALDAAHGSSIAAMDEADARRHLTVLLDVLRQHHVNLREVRRFARTILPSVDDRAWVHNVVASRVELADDSPTRLAHMKDAYVYGVPEIADAVQHRQNELDALAHANYIAASATPAVANPSFAAPPPAAVPQSQGLPPAPLAPGATTHYVHPSRLAAAARVSSVAPRLDTTPSPLPPTVRGIPDARLIDGHWEQAIATVSGTSFIPQDVCCKCRLARHRFPESCPLKVRCALCGSTSHSTFNCTIRRDAERAAKRRGGGGGGSGPKGPGPGPSGPGGAGGSNGGPPSDNGWGGAGTDSGHNPWLNPPSQDFTGEGFGPAPDHQAAWSLHPAAIAAIAKAVRESLASSPVPAAALASPMPTRSARSAKSAA